MKLKSALQYYTAWLSLQFMKQEGVCFLGTVVLGALAMVHGALFLRLPLQKREGWEGVCWVLLNDLSYGRRVNILSLDCMM